MCSPKLSPCWWNVIGQQKYAEMAPILNIHFSFNKVAVLPIMVAKITSYILACAVHCTSGQYSAVQTNWHYPPHHHLIDWKGVLNMPNLRAPTLHTGLKFNAIAQNQSVRCSTAHCTIHRLAIHDFSVQWNITLYGNALQNSLCQKNKSWNFG